MQTLTAALCPINTIREAENYAVEISSFGNTVEQRRLTASKPVIVWNITTRVLKTDEKDALVSFYQARKGPFEAFSWTDPAGTSRVVRFAPNAWAVFDVDSLNWQVTFSLVTVRQ